MSYQFIKTFFVPRRRNKIYSRNVFSWHLYLLNTYICFRSFTIWLKSSPLHVYETHIVCASKCLNRSMNSISSFSRVTSSNVVVTIRRNRNYLNDNVINLECIYIYLIYIFFLVFKYCFRYG